MADEILTPDPQTNTEGSSSEPSLMEGGTAETTPAAESTPAPAFLETLPEDLRADEAFKGFEKAEDLAKAYKEVLGKVPVVPEEYTAPPLPEGVETLDSAQWTEASRIGKEIGLTQAQIERLVAFDLNRTLVDRDMKTREVQKGIGVLKAEWGPQFQENVKLVQKGVEEFDRSYPGLKALLTSDPVLANHPVMARFFRDLGSRVVEGTLGTPKEVPTATDKPVPAAAYYPKSNMNP